MKHCLTIAGSDSSGGAGIQGDLKTFSAHATFGMSVITAVTAQNTQGVFDVEDMNPSIIANQIEAIFDDIVVHAIKIGMVSKIETIEVIAKTLKKYSLPPLVLDPVMISKSGYNLLKPEAKKALIEKLFPMATLITPNLPETEEILGYKIKNLEVMKQAAKDLHSLGPDYILVKGGHLAYTATDILYDGKNFYSFKQERIKTTHTHGTGCSLSSAITANLAKGFPMTKAVKAAKEYITTAILHGFPIGKGVGPTHHFYELYKKAGIQYE
ncbi:bifunctional hydroxymethylpyrimidine kinase/phosphomethylpyrimidine kinase [Crassaminicella thermophila]|uniref:Hydroxymethylpyrimidine/phosphomethylpyrimidine kinase n=1 Tax=Crassaminicella thermophila TaxID=2599308 RepID=A0A5C0SGV9_CRATE|nr:bifunctional hydroxymethylpyrimidine kinase/phosphomethylpyrimidine kinase [Crassaminicella thermophila]QEK12897.1 bifunctional hydroxymethylpyrimidine kinase/phosphomethylpyrimidine kinase [Crassaminicella thermophila]